MSTLAARMSDPGIFLIGGKVVYDGEGADPIAADSPNLAAYAQTVPAPSSYGGVAIKKQAQAIAAEHLNKGSHHDKAAQAIKDFAAQHEHPSVANYANRLLEHIAQAHGVHPNALGKARPKTPGIANKAGITTKQKPAP